MMEFKQYLISQILSKKQSALFGAGWAEKELLAGKRDKEIMIAFRVCTLHSGNSVFIIPTELMLCAKYYIQ
jgi:hypothetical protein